MGDAGCFFVFFLCFFCFLFLCFSLFSCVGGFTWSNLWMGFVGDWVLYVPCFVGVVLFWPS